MPELIPLLDLDGNVKKEMGADLLPYAVRHLIENQNALIKKLNKPAAKPRFTRVAPKAPAKKKK